LICCITVLALNALSCAPKATLEVSVNETDDGVMIENVGGVDCIVFVTSHDSEKQFELGVGESVRVIDMLQPIEVSAVSLANTRRL